LGGEMKKSTIDYLTDFANTTDCNGFGISLDLEYTVQSEYDILDNLNDIDLDTFSLKIA
jgi:hypothetical protein